MTDNLTPNVTPWHTMPNPRRCRDCGKPSSGTYWTRQHGYRALCSGCLRGY